jgi:hypothetical protein
MKSRFNDFKMDGRDRIRFVLFLFFLVSGLSDLSVSDLSEESGSII